MPKPKRKADRRDDALSRERIVDAAIELLDADGASGLTFRALAAHLATGAGALYWHVANKDELLVAATDAVVARALRDVADRLTPNEAIRAVAIAVFETVDAHPWVGAQLAHAPWGAATLQLFERIGQQVQALGVRGPAQFTAASTLGSYIIGISMQNAENARALERPMHRNDFLANEATRWQALSPDDYPFIHQAAPYLASHDDRAEFLAGIELLLAGIAASLSCS